MAQPLLQSDDNPVPSQSLSPEEEEKTPQVIDEKPDAESLVEFASGSNQGEDNHETGVDKAQVEVEYAIPVEPFLEPTARTSEAFEERINEMQQEMPDQTDPDRATLVNYSEAAKYAESLLNQCRSTHRYERRESQSPDAPAEKAEPTDIIELGPEVNNQDTP